MAAFLSFVAVIYDDDLLMQDGRATDGHQGSGSNQRLSF